MQITENEEFNDLIKIMIRYYSLWDKSADTPARTPRAFVSGGHSDLGVCFILFKGNKEDAMAVQKFLDKRKMK